MAVNDNPDWITRGKTIKQLIKELQSFSDLEMEVRISVDDGETHKPISLVEKSEGFCVLVNSEES
ncbi:hypothetical protein ACL7TT_18710 [Microbulbifer sp. 2304DJ12-6]|uniref:hypothetical protein n=1 Tax=Microbulbifer sp. 2304DJ12-6 TaxID=3233340 RepID=UPI0039B07F6C